MSDTAKPLPRMAAITASYQNRTSLITVNAGVGILILPAEPRRLYLAFTPAGGLGQFPIILPGPVVNGIAPANVNAGYIDWKWKDCPSVVAGEWYAYASGTLTFGCIECLYVGDQ